MLTQYLLTSPKGNQMTFKYKEGTLVYFDGSSIKDLSAVTWLLERLPITLEELKTIVAKCKYECVEVPEDLSFNRFWETYNYKIGNKKRAEQLWKALTDEEKIQVLLAIPKYDRWLKTKNGIEKLYPETFLNQRRFENQYK